jgi:hypothetical protein
MPLVIAGNSSGSTTVQATDAVTATITLPSATDTLVGKATTDTLTNKTLTLPVVGTTIGVGNATPSASGAGITFPATQSASTNANTLDDYEEGTFTPVFRDGISGTAATAGDIAGSYTKIGKLVYYQILFVNVTTTGLTAGNNVHITGLPFTTASIGASGEMNSIACINSGTPTTGCVTLNIGTSRTYGVLANQTTTGQTIFTVSQATNGAFDLFVAGSYLSS